MATQPLDQTWHVLSTEILTGMPEWRHAHPRATLREMETELDARWARLRAQLLGDLALQSSAAAWEERPVAEHPRCPQCAVPLDPRGTHTRHLQTHGGRDLALERSYGVCPSCQDGFFPPG
jgi:hypothetical protein